MTFSAVCVAVAGAYAQESHVVPVVTLCEALQHLDEYRGQAVIVIASSGFTFEGGVMNEPCEPDGRVLIHGRRWLSMIAYHYETNGSAHTGTIPADEAVLWEKAKQLHDYAAWVVPGDSPVKVNASQLGSLVAVYGRLESPVHLRPQRPGRASGNGYGANGTVPARILAMDSMTLVRGREMFVPKARTSHDLPEPPPLP